MRVVDDLTYKNKVVIFTLLLSYKHTQKMSICGGSKGEVVVEHPFLTNLGRFLLTGLY
jgi:hypothetical protein